MNGDGNGRSPREQMVRKLFELILTHEDGADEPTDVLTLMVIGLIDSSMQQDGETLMDSAKEFVNFCAENGLDPAELLETLKPVAEEVIEHYIEAFSDAVETIQEIRADAKEEAEEAARAASEAAQPAASEEPVADPGDAGLQPATRVAAPAIAD